MSVSLSPSKKRAKRGKSVAKSKRAKVPRKVRSRVKKPAYVAPAGPRQSERIRKQASLRPRTPQVESSSGSEDEDEDQPKKKKGRKA